MRETSSPIRTRAVVIGGSLAGMLAASAVRDSVDAVDILEAHPVPDGPKPRKGVPQAAHMHILLSGGAEAINSLLPGTIDRLLAEGANYVPMTTGMVLYSPEGWYRRWKNDTHYLIAGSRDLTDHVIRQQVLKDPRVTLHPATWVEGLRGDHRRVTGVRIRSADGQESTLEADLVIDASGKGTRTPRWLSELGVRGLVEESIDSGLSYASRLYRAPVGTRGWPFVSVQADPRLPATSGSGNILPIEHDRWHVSLIGPPSGAPSGSPDNFEPYARSLRHPVVADLLRQAQPLTDVTVSHSTANKRHYYEGLKTWPEGLVAVGDSVAAFNPVYGHGMSVAALGAASLRAELARKGLTDGLARRAQRAISRSVELAWSLAIGQDIRYPNAQGKRATLADRLLQRYVSRLSHTATGNFRVATAMTEVLTLQSSPACLFRPSVLTAAVIGPLRPQLSQPTLTPHELELLKRATGGQPAFIE
ncbi:NAD(P)/FAD-dependent oxidoreductase [Streptomyces flaveolus]|uniref:NAD(P)/FAD-dependent oxidoreductase n=1 Tax=Streptomyces flaveolus TaxID=67297 RepID=UPI0036F84D4B